MTAEVAIMNKEAIALAADSAVTLEYGDGQKVFTSANKLFVLSKYHPVGIMVYGNAGFMGIPWETIVKIYRRKLSQRKFNTLEQYAHSFIDFLQSRNLIIPKTQEENFLQAHTASYFFFIKKEVEKRITDIINQKGKAIDSEVRQTVSDVIERHYGRWEKAKFLPGAQKTHMKNIIKDFRRLIDKITVDIFEKLPISTSASRKLRIIAASIFCKELFSNQISGIVIAGFGEKETFPAAITHEVEGKIKGRLKYRRVKRLSQVINFSITGTIMPFAQREMVSTFMEGIHPDYKKNLEEWLRGLFNSYPEIIARNFKQIKDKDKRKLRDISKNILKDFNKNINAYEHATHVRPVVEVTSMLPKDELAVMAETLVNLTSFKRRVTMEQAETVAGPIDVAVISKGDGFIWIKRKHYFKQELNPQFLANYVGR